MTYRRNGALRILTFRLGKVGFSLTWWNKQKATRQLWNDADGYWRTTNVR